MPDCRAGALSTGALSVLLQSIRKTRPRCTSASRGAKPRPPYRRGLFKSIDGGTSWKQLSTGLPEGSSFGPLAIDPRDPGTVYLGTGTGVLRSTDGGETWSAVNSGLEGIYVRSLAIDPQDPNRVYAGTQAGLFVITFVP